MSTVGIGAVLWAALPFLFLACSSGGTGGPLVATTSTTTTTVTTTASVASTPTAGAKPTPSLGFAPLDLSRFAPLTMTQAPAGATAAPGTDSLAEITGGDLVFSIVKESRSFADAKQAIIKDTAVMFREALISTSDAIMYAANDQSQAQTFLVYVLPPRAPGYACLSRDLIDGTKTLRAFTEGQARRIVAACSSLQAR